jgi:hypothetical protein
MDMMKLKTVTTRMQGYTGVLGRARFVDGVSVEYLPRHIRDQMAASMEFVEIDADGNEQPAGSQNRMIRENKTLLEHRAALERQTDAEKLAEMTKNTLDQSPIVDLQTKEQLEEIASTGGMKALREIAVKWGVKHRSIPTLIAMILERQNAYSDARAEKLAQKVAEEVATFPIAATTIETEVPADEDLTSVVSPNQTAPVSETVEPVVDDTEGEDLAAIKAAAASGNLAAAISTEA